MSQQRPRASICVASYNHARFLPAALDSALAQTFRDFEIVVVDDGSTDDSLQIAESYAARYPRLVSVHTHPGRRNLGVSATVNRAYELSRGEFFSGLPSDDQLYPDKLERQIKFFDRHPTHDAVYSYGHYVNREGQLLPELGLFGIDVTRDPAPAERLVEGNAVPGMTMLLRRATLDRINLRHDTSLVYSDWDYWARLFARARVGFIHRPLVLYRLHDYNTSVGVGVDERVTYERGYEVLSSFRARAAEIGGAFALPRTRALIDLQLAFYSLCAGDEEGARRNFAGAFDTDASLRADAPYLARWAAAREDDVLRPPPPHDDFVRWVAGNLPPSLTATEAAAVRRALRGARFGAAARSLRSARRRFRSRLTVLSCLARDPGVLADPARLPVHLQTLAGGRLSGYALRVAGRGARDGGGGGDDAAAKTAAAEAAKGAAKGAGKGF